MSDPAASGEAAIPEPGHFLQLVERPVELRDAVNDDLPLTSPPPLPAAPPPAIVPPSSTTLRRPDCPQRSVTDPSPSTRLHQYVLTSPPPMPTIRSRHRNHSPYSRSHLRSKSGGPSLLSAPVMTRAKSMPSPFTGNNSGTPTLPSSPQRSPPRIRSPFSNNHDTSAPRSPARSDRFDGAATGIISNVPTIEEDSELDITPRQNSHTMHSPLPAASAVFSRSSSLRRRPASPLHSANVPNSTLQSPPTSYPALTDSSATSSPSLVAQRYVNEAFPSLHHSTSTSSFSASSIPSTPSSIRSRSPSISSLDTIEDAPDAEFAAAANAEAERLERLHAAAETQERLKRAGLEVEDDSADGGSRRRSSFESGRMGRGLGRPGHQGGERKRWSICGGERRADLDLETIWED